MSHNRVINISVQLLDFSLNFVDYVLSNLKSQIATSSFHIQLGNYFVDYRPA